MTMKLSEAIRLGAMLAPQGRTRLLSADGSTCALGAALAAVGQLASVGNDPQGYDTIKAVWPWLGHQQAMFPSGMTGRVLGGIWQLNDTHGWTREQIADWVAQVEPAEPEAPALTPEPAHATVLAAH